MSGITIGDGWATRLPSSVSESSQLPHNISLILNVVHPDHCACVGTYGIAMSAASVKSTDESAKSGPTSPPAVPAATNANVDVLAGHLGHLTDEQQKALATFKTNIINAGLYKAPGSTGIDGGGTHDEPTLLRFLRARRFDPIKAQKQFADAEAWRKKHNVDELFASFDVEEFELSKKFYPKWTGRRDKNGLPVYVYRLASLNGSVQKELNQVSAERRYQRIIALYEVMWRFVMPFCSSLPRRTAPTPVSSVTTIIDLEQVSLTSMWNLRNHLQEASTLATANYPETLNTIAVINSPSFFPTVWGWIKGWFDEGTRTKIHVLGKDPGPTLRSLIDEENLPKAYGGKLDWTFEDDPSIDSDMIERIGKMPRGPVIWVDEKVVRPAKAPPTPEPSTAAAS
ncbi:CRAL/TRIO domain-containing protein [Cristinia sonorae]|uniref:CRAL/TRIO domain-containing protein n=1 Tax=Cristinia sonorae TaxID=1940300 RepID=A0A8K0UDX0_9AGAR|nr:CRAL/TRIO domain-containing protein [Cristinia sonorae]